MMKDRIANMYHLTCSIRKKKKKKKLVIEQNINISGNHLHNFHVNIKRRFKFFEIEKKQLTLPLQTFYKMQLNNQRNLKMFYFESQQYIQLYLLHHHHQC